MDWTLDTLQQNRGKLLSTDIGIRSYLPTTIEPRRWSVRDDMGTTTNICHVTADWLIDWLNRHEAEVLPDENDGGPLEFTMQDRYDKAAGDFLELYRELGRWYNPLAYRPDASEADAKRMEEVAARLQYALEAARVEVEYIRRDVAAFSGAERYTHYPSERTIVRQPYMNNVQWADRKVAFFAQYPAAKIREE